MPANAKEQCEQWLFARLHEQMLALEDMNVKDKNIIHMSFLKNINYITQQI